GGQPVERLAGQLDQARCALPRFDRVGDRDVAVAARSYQFHEPLVVTRQGMPQALLEGGPVHHARSYLASQLAKLGNRVSLRQRYGQQTGRIEVGMVASPPKRAAR